MLRASSLIKSFHFQVAEKVKEFFHNEGIHSTTIQPEFVEAVAGENTGSISSSEDCMITCPRPGPTIDQVSGFRFQRRDEATDPGVVSLLLPGLASVSVSSSSSQPSL